MAKLTFAAIALMCVLSALTATAVGPYYPKAWVDLFQPPYTNCPQIMMSLGCLSRNVCYIPGGSNGVGFGVYKFNGEWNGEFVAMHQIDNIPIDFTLQVGVGGTEAAPHGAVGGAGLFFGLKYFVNASWLAPSITTPFTETMDIRTDSTGMKVLFIDGMSAWGSTAMYSTDGAITFKNYKIPRPWANPNCTLPQYQAIAGDGIWYFASGSFPEKKKHSGSGSGSSGSGSSGSSSGGDDHSSPLRYLTKSIGIVRPEAELKDVEAMGFKTMKHIPKSVRRSRLQLNKEWIAAGRPSAEVAGEKCGYTAAIAKTTNYGSTWETQEFNTTSWSINDIDCADATNCLFVADGFKQDPAGRVFRTEDGSTWKEVLTLPSEEGAVIYSLNNVRFNPANKKEAWVAGGVETAQGGSALFYYTQDGGKTWAKHGEINFVEEVIAMSMTPDGTGFATGITQFNDFTIMRYTYNGPPATPAPTWAGNFTQRQCADNACSVNCTDLSLPQNTCLNMTGGGSAKAQCDMTDQVLIQDFYPIDDTCWGPYAPEPQAINVCFEAGNGGSFINFCGPTNGATFDPSAKMMRAKAPVKKH